MEKKVKNIISAAKNDKHFQFELKKHEPQNYKLNCLSNDTEKIIYASIYMGWLIGKGTYDESFFLINNRFNVVYHLLYLVKKLFYKLKNKNMTFSEYIIKERGETFYKICLVDCIRFGIIIEDYLSNTYTEWCILYNSK